MKKTLLPLIVLCTFVFATETNNNIPTEILPNLKMPDNNLTFKMIEGYQDYKVVATHFRTDKNELRYILANPVAYEALKKEKKVMPEGSKIVKIGWKVKKMGLFPAALEAESYNAPKSLDNNSSLDLSYSIQ